MGNSHRPPAHRTQPKEPGHPLFWIIITALLFVVVPYFYAGSSEPRIAGLPVWFYLSLLATLIISGLSVWRIWKHWRLEDDE